VSGVFDDIVEPGFFSSGIVHSALLTGGVVAAVCGAVGVFTVVRSQSFTGHSLSDVGATGGSAAYLVGLTPLVGFVAVALAAGWAVELIGLRNPRGRDLAMGIVLGAALGLAALFLYLDSTHTATTGATTTILFGGSLFVISASTISAIVALAVVSITLVLALERRLLLSALGADLAAARGVSVRVVGLAYVTALALAVGLAAVTIGAVLGTALLVGPSATALRLARRPGTAMAAAAAIGVAATWLGILCAYDSYYWPPVGHGWPVSFLVVAFVLAFYLLLPLARRRSSLRRPAVT
jgi:zinc/manganese transport system permease protein